MIDSFLVFLLNFIDFRIGPLTISDFSLIFLIAHAFIYVKHLKIPKNEIYGLILMGVGIVLSTCLNFSKSYFNNVEFLKSFFKLFIYLIGIYYIPKYLIAKNIEVFKIIEKYMIISVMGAILQYLIVFIFGRDSWPLYSLGSHFFGLNMEITMFNNLGMMRARSFYSEPAHFAVHLSMLFSLLCFNKSRKMPTYLHLVYIIGIICANSISGYGIMIILYVVFLISFKSYNKALLMIIGGIGSVIGVVSLILTNDYLRGRLINLFLLKDNSGVVRTVGGFQFLKYIPWYGVGIGNNATFYSSMTEIDSFWFSGSGEFYNNILLSIITMGYIGMFGFILYQYLVLKKDIKLFIALMITHFGWGKLWVTPLWVFLMIYKVYCYQMVKPSELNSKKFHLKYFNNNKIDKESLKYD